MGSARFDIAGCTGKPLSSQRRGALSNKSWPEFRELSGALAAYLAEITEKLIREEVHGETADAEEREEPRRLNR
jgi:hypothetical protein